MSRRPGFLPDSAAALASGPFMAKLNRTVLGLTRASRLDPGVKLGGDDKTEPG